MATIEEYRAEVLAKKPLINDLHRAINRLNRLYRETEAAVSVTNPFLTELFPNETRVNAHRTRQGALFTDAENEVRAAVTALWGSK